MPDADKRTTFWDHVEKLPSGCWVWRGTLNDGGYGVWKRQLAHRVAWRLEYRQPIPTGLFILHICDNPPCCNPNHLRLGDARENYHDMVAKGRGDPRWMKWSPREQKEAKRKAAIRKSALGRIARREKRLALREANLADATRTAGCVVASIEKYLAGRAEISDHFNCDRLRLGEVREWVAGLDKIKRLG